MALSEAFLSATEQLAGTASSSPLADKAYTQLAAYIEQAPPNEKLERFKEIIGVHTNAWKDTGLSFVKLHTRTISLFIEEMPEIAYMEESLRSDIDEISRKATEIPRYAANPGHTVADINVWSAKKQTVAQLFDLIRLVPDSDKSAALDFLEESAEKVAAMMHTTGIKESELLKLGEVAMTERDAAQSKDDFAMAVSRLKGNVRYHPEVARDWQALANAATVYAQNIRNDGTKYPDIKISP